MSLDITNQQLIWWEYNWEPKVAQVNIDWSLKTTSWPWWNGVTSDITSDVWGRPKTTLDFSLFHWLWTYNIPSQLWLTFEDWVEILPSTRITSDAWHWSIKSWTTLWDTAFLRSKRHPRYQPNRWHLFSTAWFMPVPTATWIRQLGFKNTIAWCYFQLEDWVLYAVILDDSVEKVKQVIDVTLAWLISTADLANWTLYDIQFQWRGVWDYYFYINQKLVYQTNFLWNNTELTIANPAISAGVYCENTDWTQVEIRLWCVDISTEWGKREGATYVSVANAITKAVTTASYPVIIAHIKSTLSSLPNTRDVLALRVTWSSDQKSRMKAYITRDWTAITGASFSDAQQGSWIEFDTVATAITTANCQLLWSKRVQLDGSAEVDLPSDLIDFVLSEWDYLIITMERENPTQTANVDVTLEMWEEI